jgi:adenosine deaminase CECR1
MAFIPVNENTYFEERDKLIGTDRALRRDSSYIQSRSALEKEADEIVRRIRADEAESIWKEDHPDVLHPFPGMEFLTGQYSLCLIIQLSEVSTGRKIIEKTHIFKILSQVGNRFYRTPDLIHGSVYRCQKALSCMHICRL